MKQLFSKLSEIKTHLIQVINVYIFLLSGKKRQRYLIEKNACMFLGLQNHANKYEEEGDTRTAMVVSGESYLYLTNFVLYCDAKKIDPIKTLNQYKS